MGEADGQGLSSKKSISKAEFNNLGLKPMNIVRELGQS